MSAKNGKTSAAYEKKVRAAIADLEKEGKRVTNASVREKLEGGSFRDLGPIVKAVKAEKEAREKAESEVPDMPEDVRELATAMWEGAYRLADEVAAADRRKHADELRARDQDLADKEEEVNVVEDERDEWEARALSAEARTADLTDLVTELRMKIARLEGRLLGRQEAHPPKDQGDPMEAEEEDSRQMSLFPDGEDVHPERGSDDLSKDGKPGGKKAA